MLRYSTRARFGVQEPRWRGTAHADPLALSRLLRVRGDPVEEGMLTW